MSGSNADVNWRKKIIFNVWFLVFNSTSCAVDRLGMTPFVLAIANEQWSTVTALANSKCFERTGVVHPLLDFVLPKVSDSKGYGRLKALLHQLMSLGVSVNDIRISDDSQV